MATSNAVQRVLNVLDAGSPEKFAVKNIAHLNYFGAAEDGVTDDTEPLNNALSYLDNLGGGTLFFGGNISVDNFSIPKRVTLSGTKAGPFSSINYQNVAKYPVLMCRNPSLSVPFISLASLDSGLENCAIYYPTQVNPSTASVPVSYDYSILSPTVSNGGNKVRAVTIINSYNGIYGNFARGGIQNCLIGAFSIGIFIDGQEDYGLLTDTYVDLMYDVYEILSPTSQPLDAYTKNNLQALVIGRADGIQVNNFGVFWCALGFVPTTSIISGISPNNGYGQINNLSIDTALYGVNALSSNAQGGGYVITNANIATENDGIVFNGATIIFKDTILRVQSGNPIALGSTPGNYSFNGYIVSGSNAAIEKFTQSSISAVQAYPQGGSESVSSTTASGSITASAAQLAGGYLADGATQTAAFTVTTDTAANILAAMPNAAVGTSFKFRFINNDQSSTGYAGTLAGGTGVTVGTVLPNPAVPKGGYEDYVFTFTAIGASPTLTVEAVGGNGTGLL